MISLIPDHVAAGGEDGTVNAEVTKVEGQLAVITVSGRPNHTTGWRLRSVITECLSLDLSVLIVDLTALEACDEADLQPARQLALM
ncbi:hypothetical protein [Streptomyces cyanogenus]|uniref:hypothetical protein n=1 Tax=Streptomyces cyanogenus TaxID=80860 RepID=UPI001AA120CE|nr:hypothetical protein [Streptomyces cyanogenus]